MPDPAKHVVAEIRYEIAIIGGPREFEFRSAKIRLTADEQIVVLMRVTFMGRDIIDRTVAGIIGDESRLSCQRFLELSRFLRNGGVIGLHRDLL